MRLLEPVALERDRPERVVPDVPVGPVPDRFDRRALRLVVSAEIAQAEGHAAVRGRVGGIFDERGTELLDGLVQPALLHQQPSTLDVNAHPVRVRDRARA